jgi:hypothetical protein
VHPPTRSLEKQANHSRQVFPLFFPRLSFIQLLIIGNLSVGNHMRSQSRNAQRVAMWNAISAWSVTEKLRRPWRLIGSSQNGFRRVDSASTWERIRSHQRNRGIWTAWKFWKIGCESIFVTCLVFKEKSNPKHSILWCIPGVKLWIFESTRTHFRSVNH